MVETCINKHAVDGMRTIRFQRTRFGETPRRRSNFYGCSPRHSLHPVTLKTASTELTNFSRSLNTQRGLNKPLVAHRPKKVQSIRLTESSDGLA